MTLAALALHVLLASPVLAGPPIAPAPPAPPPAPGLFARDDDDDDDEDRQADSSAWSHLSRDQIFELLKAREIARIPRVPQGRAVEIVVPLGFFVAVVLVVACILLFRSRRERERYTTIRHLVEKGAALPPSLLDPPRPPHADLRRGLLVGAGAVGLGLCLGLLPDVPPRVWTVALMPALVALAYLANWTIVRRVHAAEPMVTVRERQVEPLHEPTAPGAGVG